MSKLNMSLLAIAAAAAVTLAPLAANAKEVQAKPDVAMKTHLAANAKEHRAQPRTAVTTQKISPRVAAAHAQAQTPAQTPRVTSLAQSLAEGANGAGPKCTPGGKILLQDGVEHVCQ